MNFILKKNWMIDNFDNILKIIIMDITIYLNLIFTIFG